MSAATMARPAKTAGETAEKTAAKTAAKTIATTKVDDDSKGGLEDMKIKSFKSDSQGRDAAGTCSLKQVLLKK